ncbi:MAG: glycosyltransferase family 39 protein, partial [Phormidesmis sp.]
MTTKILQTHSSSRDASTPASASYSWLPISLILVFATALFTFRLEGEGLWLDELTSIQDADLGLWALFKENQLRPLYYFLLKGWMQFGSSDAWLRSLSVVCAVISVFLLYKLGRRLMGEAEGLIAALLMSVSPVFNNHTQEIRMYILSLCLATAGTLFLTEALL